MSDAIFSHLCLARTLFWIRSSRSATVGPLSLSVSSLSQKNFNILVLNFLGFLAWSIYTFVQSILPPTRFLLSDLPISYTYTLQKQLVSHLLRLL